MPGEPENGVRDVGGVVALPGCPPKNPPGEAIEGGEAGEDGPPLEVFGGLMRFSFCRLLKKLMKYKRAKLIAISSFNVKRNKIYRLTGYKTKREPLLFPC